jgi:hypothetical protein
MADTKLSELIPHYDVIETHEISLPVPPDAAMAAVKAVTGAEIRLMGPLMAVRTIPHLLRRTPVGIDRRAPALEAMLAMGFSPLAADGHEVVIGAIGRFWRLSDNLPVPGIAGSADFSGFDRPDYAKAAVGFRVEADGAGSRVITETRVVCTSDAARKRFRLYWFFIGFGSALIRRSWLAAIARRVRRSAPRGVSVAA